jgi:HlyD family secretion protein
LFLIASDLTKMQVDTNVSESDIGSIKVGQKSTFAVDAFPKRIFEGVVAQVRQSPQTVQNVVTYDIVITVDNRDLSLKPGLTAATRIIVDQRDDVVRLPNAALRYRPSTGARAAVVDRGQTLVWIVRDGEPTPVPVVTGLEDDNFTELAGGELKPGDQVIVADQRASAPASLRLRF